MKEIDSIIIHCSATPTKRILYLILVLLPAMLFCSCATSRNIDTQKQVDYSEDFKRIQSAVESLQMNVSKQVQETTDKLSNLKIENKTVILSPPDSTGRQYPVQESTTIASKDEQERTEFSESLTITMQQLVTRVDILTAKVNAMTKEKEKVIELSWWDLHKDKVYGGVIFLLIIGWILKSRIK